MLDLRSSHFCLAACLWGACAAASLSAPPASAQPAASVHPAPAAPSAGALTPAQGAAQALDHAHAAKTLSALNPCLTNEFAAFYGCELGVAVSTMSDEAALSPKEKSSRAAAEKVFSNKMDALMNRYSGTDKALKPSEKPPGFPAVVTHGRQFLSDALVLLSDYEKAVPSKDGLPLDAVGSRSLFPASSACTFKVLSPTRVHIVSRKEPQIGFVARLEEGQWRIGPEYPVFNESGYAPKPNTPPLTPQATAFIEAVTDGDAAVVRRMLKANPALADTPPTYREPHFPIVSDFPLTIASYSYDVPVAMLLLKAGAKVNAQNDDGETALDKAAYFGIKALILILLAHGANIAHKDASGDTALHQAVASPYGAHVVAILLAHGADVNARDEDGETPLDLALARPSYAPNRAAIINLLRRHGAKK